MFKVFIADDEIFVLKLIEHLIDWTAMGLEIVGTADNGLTAYDEIMRLKPDIVIVDVRMPGCDGISLMQKVRAVDERVRFVMISGHKNFEYAKSAMKYNVEDYVLKPINKGELEAVLTAVTGKLEKERDADNERQSNDKAASVNLSRLFLERYLSGEMTVPELSVQLIGEKYFLDLSANVLRFGIIQLNSRENGLDQAFVQTVMALVERHFMEEMQGITQSVVVHYASRAATFLLNYDANNEAAVMDHIASFHEKMRAILTKFEKLSINVCLGAPVNTPDKLDDSYESAKIAQCSRMVLGLDRLIDCASVKRIPAQKLELFGERPTQALQSAIRSLDVKKIRMQVNDLFAHAEMICPVNHCIYSDVSCFVLHEFYRHIHQLDLFKGSFHDYMARCEQALNECATPAELSASIMKEISDFIGRFMDEGQSDDHPAIRIAKRYIAENYKMPITLNVMAGVVSMSPIYFSAVFKKEVGVNFLEYLHQFRIAKSKQLLCDVCLNISEVALESGFSDPRHFAKVFRKIVGITPTEYRNYHVE